MVTAPFAKVPNCRHPYIQGALHSVGTIYDSRDTPPFLPNLGTSDTHSPATSHGSNATNLPNLYRFVQLILSQIPAHVPPDR